MSDGVSDGMGDRQLATLEQGKAALAAAEMQSNLAFHAMQYKRKAWEKAEEDVAAEPAGGWSAGARAARAEYEEAVRAYQPLANRVEALRGQMLALEETTAYAGLQATTAAAAHERLNAPGPFLEGADFPAPSSPDAPTPAQMRARFDSVRRLSSGGVTPKELLTDELTRMMGLLRRIAAADGARGVGDEKLATLAWRLWQMTAHAYTRRGGEVALREALAAYVARYALLAEGGPSAFHAMLGDYPKEEPAGKTARGAGAGEESGAEEVRAPF